MNDTYINDFYKIIGKNVKRIRKEKGISQLDLSHRIGHKSVSIISCAEINHKKNINKDGLKYIDLKSNFSFYIYIFYLLSILCIGYYFYNTYFNIVEKKEEIIDFESIKSKITFNSFEEKFYVISKNIDKNRLVLNSFDYRHDTAKIVVSSSNKENIDKFLESCENVISSSTHFNEESKIFEATIDVGKL